MSTWAASERPSGPSVPPGGEPWGGPGSARASYCPVILSVNGPLRRPSADLFGQGDDDARGAAEIAEPEDALVLRHLAEEFGPVGAQAGDGIVDVVDGEHDAMQTQRVGRRALRLGAYRRGDVVLGQLQLAVAVRGPHHRHS